MAMVRSSILNGVEQHCEVLKIGDYELALYTMKNPAGDDLNEDSLGFVALSDGTLVVMVADGVGGHPKGAEASRKVLLAIERNLAKASSESPPGDAVRTAILNGIEKANHQLLEEAIGSRTTVTICELRGTTARTYQVGDSELLICGQKGRIKYKTWSHSPVGYGVQAGLITEQAALSHPDRHFISNVVGEAEMRIEMGPRVELSPRDTILVGSDGLYDNFSHSDLSDLVRVGHIEDVLEKMANKLERRLRMAGSELNPDIKFDDVSFVTVRLAS